MGCFPFTMLKLLPSIMLCSVACAYAVPGELDSRASTTNFTLFAYGTDSDTEIGGFPLVYNGGYAYIADPAKVNFTLDYVYFVDNSSQWVANALNDDSATWSPSLFYIPDGSGSVGFYQAGGNSSVSSSDIITTGFTFYGGNAMVAIDDIYYTDWYAENTTMDGLWSVGWDATDSSTVELLSLRSSGGTNVDYL